MSNRAELLQKARKQRVEREGQRQQEAETAARQRVEEAAALCIQRVYRGSVDRQQWSDAEWKSLQKQVHDLEQLAEFVRQKGQQFLAPCRVLLPLLCRAAHQVRQPAGERAELCARLGGFANAGLLAPLSDAQRGLCAFLSTAAAQERPMHLPDPVRVLLRFSEALFAAIVAAGSAAGACELAQFLDARAWGQGKGMEESGGCQVLAARLFASALEVSVWPAGGRGPPKRLKAWRAATASAIGAWPGSGASVPPRLQGLAGVGAAWLRLAGCVGGGGAPPAMAAASELIEAVFGVPRIGSLLAAQHAPVAGAAPAPWARLLRAYAQSLREAEGLGGGAARQPQVKGLDREYMLVYTAGNLWEVHAQVGLPLEPLLAVQCVLAKHLEVSMLPGGSVPSLDEPVAVQALRDQLRHFADPAAVVKLFGRVLHFQPQQAGPASLARPMRPYQRHCLAVVLHEVSPPAVASLCQLYSTVLLRARTAIKASKAGLGTQVYFGLANTIAYMEKGDVAKVLWRFALGFFDLGAAHQPAACLHALHLLASVLTQLLSVMSHDELRGSGGPLCDHDLAGYIALTTRLAARLIWDGAAAAPEEAGGAAAAAGGGGGALLEALLEQLGRVLSQLNGFMGRLATGAGAPGPATWHAPSDILQEFRQAMESTQPQRLPGRFACAEKLLRHLPHSVPFEQRVALLRKWIQEKRDESRGVPAVKLAVRRTHIFEDGLVALSKADWRARFQVSFVNAAGMQEQGQDAGGLFKEFWEKLAETAFNPDYGLFRATESRLLYPSPDASRYHEHTAKLFEFLGLVIGKAIYEGIVVEPCFAPFFLAKLLGRHNSYYDLQTLDPSLFANLQRLKSYDGNVADLCCSFVATSADGEEVPLLPGGENMAVTGENRFRYVYLLSDYKLNKELRAGSAAFLTGFQRLLDERWLRMFGEEELQQVISGSTDNKLDVEDLQRHTQCSNCGPREKFTLDFFRAVAAMSTKQQVSVLRFVTSCSRTPLLGFSHLVPPFTLHKVHVRSDSDKLPTASTCFNTLKLPAYSSWKVMKAKLEFVIEQGAGFELD